MTGTLKSLFPLVALTALTAACAEHTVHEGSQTVQTGSGIEFQLGAPELSANWTTVNLWIEGVPGDLSVGFAADGTLQVDGVIDATIYDLVLEKDQMVVHISDGFEVRTHTVALTREDDTPMLEEAFDHFPELPHRPLGYPFDGDISHEVALTTLAVLAETQPELQASVEVMIAATLALEVLTPEGSADEATPIDDGYDAGTPSTRSGTAAYGDGVETIDEREVECAEGDRVQKAFNVGPELNLDAGPVSVTMTAVNVSGTSSCHPRYSPMIGDTGSLSASYDPSGGSAAGCSDKYEAAYTLSGNKTASAANGPCCFADGATDTAEVGAFTAEVFGRSFRLNAAVAKASSDMSARAEATISGSATVCIDYDFKNEAMLLGSTTASAICQ